MNPQIAEAIGPIIATLAMGTFTLIGMKMWLRYRTERLRLQAEAPQAEALTDAVESLRDELAIVRQDVAELHERVDFAERLLAREKDERQRQLPS